MQRHQAYEFVVRCTGVYIKLALVKSRVDYCNALLSGQPGALDVLQSSERISSSNVCRAWPQSSQRACMLDQGSQVTVCSRCSHLLSIMASCHHNINKLHPHRDWLYIAYRPICLKFWTATPRLQAQFTELSVFDAESLSLPHGIHYSL